MTAITVYAGSLERVESLVFAKDPARSRVGDVETFYDRVYTERTLGTLDDPDAASETLRAILLGPAPDTPLGQSHAIVFRSIIETICARIDDDAFASLNLAGARAFGQRLTPALGPALAESVDQRRLPFLDFDKSLQSPVFSYWTRAELRHFLDRYDAAAELVAGDSEATDRLRRLQGVWRSALAQGPDAILVITL